MTAATTPASTDALIPSPLRSGRPRERSARSGTPPLQVPVLERSQVWPRWCGWCVIAGVSLPIRREVVVEFGASIDGSLLYGDLPALDGAETTDIAEALVSEFERRPQHPKSPASRIGVGRADCNLRVEFECGASGVVAS
jgi:hypothetical protein